MRFTALLLTFLIAGCNFGEASDSTCPKGMAKLFVHPDAYDTTTTVAELRVEVADTNEKRRIGLMNRRSMPSHHGMIFTWPDRSGGRYMWMKNTYIPLDMLFIDEGQIVAIIENTTPHDETPRGTEQLVNAVLEVNAGWVRNNKVRIGQAIRLQDCRAPKAGQ